MACLCNEHPVIATSYCEDWGKQGYIFTIFNCLKQFWICVLFKISVMLICRFKLPLLIWEERIIHWKDFPPFFSNGDNFGTAFLYIKPNLKRGSFLKVRTGSWKGFFPYRVNLTKKGGKNTDDRAPWVAHCFKVDHIYQVKQNILSLALLQVHFHRCHN